jgi:hypothetical protein
MGLNLNKDHLSVDPVNVIINDLIEKADPPEEKIRGYLGASVIGSECMRRAQYDWMCDPPAHGVRLRDIFDRGHWGEDLSREHLKRAKFKFAASDDPGLKFCSADGQFRGHIDGKILGGPAVPGVGYPCCWEHKCVNDRGWKDLERDGLAKAYPGYFIQVQIYMAYLSLTKHPTLFTALNANDCHRLHLLVPFDPVKAQLWSDRAAEIIRATRVGELLPRFTENPNDYRCKNLCGHYERCWKRPVARAA